MDDLLKAIDGDGRSLQVGKTFNLKLTGQSNFDPRVLH
jgi:hypothetical protein